MARFRNDAPFNLRARMILACAFVPTNDLDDAVDALSAELPQELQPLLDWFEDSYLGWRLVYLQLPIGKFMTIFYYNFRKTKSGKKW